MDKCGICDGNNESCEEVSQVVPAPTSYGYSHVVDIPPRSTNIFIHRQRDGDDLGCLGMLTSLNSFVCRILGMFYLVLLLNFQNPLKSRLIIFRLFT